MPISDEDFLRKLRAAFEIEAREHLQAISAGLLSLESHPAARENAGIVEGIFRAAHSLKGAARSVDRLDIEAACHGLETTFSGWKSHGVEGTRESFDELNGAVSRLETMLGAATPPEPAAEAPSLPPAAPSPAASAASAAPPPLPPAHEEPHPAEARASTVRIPVARMDALLRQVEEMTMLKNAARERLAELRELRRSVSAWRSEYSLLAWAQRGAASPVVHQIRGWLEAGESSLGRLEEKMDSDRRAFGGLVDGLLEDAKALSMLRFSAVLDPLPRAVRELARASGKMAELSLEGTEVELDKRILEQIKDPLLHLVRNCVAHGIEPPSLRLERGKPETGRLRIRVSYRNATQVEIAVSDDGGGLDEAGLKEAAVAAGALSAEEAAHLEERNAQRLVFRGGLSTSAAITPLSGRGLGMSIVSERVEELGGTVDVESQPGRGTLFRILLPVTYATFRGVIVECGRELIVIPSANIERALRVPRTQVQRGGGRETVPWQGGTLPLARLRTVLGIEKSPTRFSGDVLQVLVLNAGPERLAFAVDEVRDQMDLLLKPFRRPILHARNFAAATLLPNGCAVLILNVAEAIESAVAQGNESAFAEPEPLPLAKQARDILVADDSVTSRMLLKNILETAGYRVRTASDGVDALTALRTQRFDLVVSDVQMPRMDGFDFTARVRADQHLAHLPIVLVTALESPQDRARGEEAGASAYIVKGSFNQSDLLEAVGKLL